MTVPTYDRIQNSEIDEGSPLTNGLFVKIRNNLLAAFGGDPDTTDITTETDTTKVLTPDGTGGVTWSTVPVTIPVISGWADGGTVSVSATSAPTKPTSMTTDKVWYRRVDDSMQLRIEYLVNTFTGGTNGSGEYIYTLPGGYSFDTTKIGVDASSDTQTRMAYAIGKVIGKNDSGSYLLGWIVPYDATRFRIVAHDIAGTTVQYQDGNTPWFGLAQLKSMNIEATFPISGW